MSVVAMYFDKKKRTIYAASDGITMVGHNLTAIDAIKLHKGKQCIIGSCGSTFLGQVFPRALTKLTDACVKQAKNAVHFGELIADTLAADPKWHEFSMKTQQRSPDSNVIMLAGCKYGLFIMYAPDYNFARISHPYYAIGAGGELSTGALLQWANSKNKVSPGEAVKSAVAAACNGSMYVTGRIRLEKVKV